MLGSLNAQVVIVGQDFSATERRHGPTHEPDPTIPTNRNLMRLIGAAGLRPEQVYLSNAILCLKPGTQLNGATRAAWFHACRPLLRDTIDIVTPRAVVALGARAWDSLQRACGLAPIPLGLAVDEAPRAGAGGLQLHARYHCGGLGLVARPLNRQVEDWRRLGSLLRQTDAQPV